MVQSTPQMVSYPVASWVLWVWRKLLLLDWGCRLTSICGISLYCPHLKVVAEVVFVVKGFKSFLFKAAQFMLESCARIPVNLEGFCYYSERDFQILYIYCMCFRLHVTKRATVNISAYLSALVYLLHFGFDVQLAQRCQDLRRRSFFNQHPTPHSDRPFWSLQKVLDLLSFPGWYRICLWKCFLRQLSFL